jgi:alpha-galactosidase
VRTCEGFPGQFEHEYQDAQTLAEWGVDWWKHDNCCACYGHTAP